MFFHLDQLLIYLSTSTGAGTERVYQEVQYPGQGVKPCTLLPRSHVNPHLLSEAIWTSYSPLSTSATSLFSKPLS